MTAMNPQYCTRLFAMFLLPMFVSIETIDVVVNDVITVQSKRFPNACCEVVNYTFVLEDGSFDLLPLHVTFSDLDIPLGTVFLFADENNTPFEEQIRISKKPPLGYDRKTLIFDRVPVYLSVIPAHDNPTTYYAGYRFQIYSYLKEKMADEKYYWNTDERCPSMRPPMEGGMIVMKWDKTLYDNNVKSLPVVPMHDCMWVLKVPPEFEHSTYKTPPQVFIRFNKLAIDEVLLADFSLEVVYAPYSTGSPRTIIDKSNYKEEENRFFHHSKAMYIRLRLPYISSIGSGMNKYNIHFVYGMMAKTSEDGTGCSMGFLPSFSCFKSGVCIIMANKCDGIEHCPNFEDELPETCAKSHTTTKSSVAVPTGISRLDVCPGTSVMCLWPSNHCVEAAEYFRKCQINDRYVKKNFVTQTPKTTPPRPLATPVRTCPSVADTLCDNGYCAPYAWCSLCGPTSDTSSILKRCPDKVKVCVIKYDPCPKENPSCTYMTKKCPDGTCVASWQPCPSKPDGCDSNSKRCSDGTCISIFGGVCPDEICPSYKPYKCGVSCYYEGDRCDGSCDCGNCKDEENCPGTDLHSHADLRGFIALLAIFPVMFGCIMCCEVMKKRRLRRQSQYTGYSTTPMQPRNLAANTSAYQHTSQTYYVPPPSVPSPNIQYPISIDSDSVPQQSLSHQRPGVYGYITTRSHRGSNQFDPPPYDIAVTSSAKPTLQPLYPTTGDVEVLGPPPSYESLVTPSAPLPDT